MRSRTASTARVRRRNRRVLKQRHNWDTTTRRACRRAEHASFSPISTRRRTRGVRDRPRMTDTPKSRTASTRRLTYLATFLRVRRRTSKHPNRFSRTFFTLLSLSVVKPREKRGSKAPSGFNAKTTLRRKWSRNETSEDRNVRSKCRCSCVLQFTCRRAISCVLHRSTSQVIRRSG